MHLLIIGGSDAGVSAALRAHELDGSVEVTMVVADDYPNFSICGLPYFLSGETPNWRDLAHRTEFPGINVLRRHVAEAIDATNKRVLIRSASEEKLVRYDRLIVATGAEPIRPELPGNDLEGVFVLHSMEDSFAVHRHLSECAPTKAVLIGAGYIGLEMADALTQRGLEVTLLSRSQTVLPTVDPALGRIVGAELRRHGVRVFTGVSAHAIEQNSASTEARLGVVDFERRPPSRGFGDIRRGRSPQRRSRVSRRRRVRNKRRNQSDAAYVDEPARRLCGRRLR